MAQGDVKGSITGDGADVTDPCIITGSVAVSVGDLIVAVYGAQITLVAVAVTDNLGNTYTAQNAGTDSGNMTGRMFYSRAANAGTLTSVSFDTSETSTRNWVAAAAVIEGPFESSPIDASPANVQDLTSPFTCPASGVLSAANEVVIGWLASNDNTALSATSPNVMAASSIGSGNTAAIGSQVVAATTSVAPAFTAAVNPSSNVLGTASFRLTASAKSIVADAGSYVLSGNTAQLERGREATADAGSYAVSGVDANLERGREVVADAGSYAITGSSASLEISREVLADAGAYALTGADAALLVAEEVVIVAEVGAYAVNGADVILEIEGQEQPPAPPHSSSGWWSPAPEQFVLPPLLAVVDMDERPDTCEAVASIAFDTVAIDNDFLLMAA